MELASFCMSIIDPCYFSLTICHADSSLGNAFHDNSQMSEANVKNSSIAQNGSDTMVNPVILTHGR